jgi:hypothetical protein
MIGILVLLTLLSTSLAQYMLVSEIQCEASNLHILANITSVADGTFSIMAGKTSINSDNETIYSFTHTFFTQELTEGYASYHWIVDVDSDHGTLFWVAKWPLDFDDESQISISTQCRDPVAFSLVGIIIFCAVLIYPCLLCVKSICDCVAKRNGTYAEPDTSDLADPFDDGLDPNTPFCTGLPKYLKYNMLETSIFFKLHPAHPFKRWIRIMCLLSNFIIAFVFGRLMLDIKNDPDASEMGVKFALGIFTTVWSSILCWLGSCSLSVKTCKDYPACQDLMRYLSLVLLAPFIITSYASFYLQLKELDSSEIDSTEFVEDWALSYIGSIFMSALKAAAMYYFCRRWCVKKVEPDVSLEKLTIVSSSEL